MGQFQVKAPLYAAGVALAAAFSTPFADGALPVFSGAVLFWCAGRSIFRLSPQGAPIQAGVTVPPHGSIS